MVLLRLNLPTHLTTSGRQEYHIGFRDLLIWRQAMGLMSPKSTAVEVRPQANKYDSKADQLPAEDVKDCPQNEGKGNSDIKRTEEELEIEWNRREALEILEGKRRPRPGSCPDWLRERMQALERTKRTQFVLKRANERAFKQNQAQQMSRPVQKNTTTHLRPFLCQTAKPPPTKTPEAPKVVVVPGPFARTEPQVSRAPPKVFEAEKPTGPVNTWSVLRRIMLSSLYGSDRRPFRVIPEDRSLYLLRTKRVKGKQNMETVEEARNLSECTMEEFQQLMEGVEGSAWQDMIWVADVGEIPPHKFPRDPGRPQPKLLKWGREMF